MAELNLDDQATLNAAELGDAIIAVQGGNPKQWRKVTPNQLLTLIGVTPTGSVVGQRIASFEVGVGSYTRNNLFTWVLDPNTPTGFTVNDVTFGGTTYTDVRLSWTTTESKRLADRHIGWLFQYKLDGVIFNEATYTLSGLPSGVNRWGMYILPSYFPASPSNPPAIIGGDPASYSGS